MKDTYYTIHFECEATGENSDSYIFATKEEAENHPEYEYPGYGHIWLKEISREDALDALIATIDEWVDEWLHDDAIDIDPEDYEVVEPKWFAEMIKYITWAEPGWQLLYEEYIEHSPEDKAILISALKDEMRVCKELYESGQRKEMPDTYYNAKKVLKEIGG